MLGLKQCTAGSVGASGDKPVQTRQSGSEPFPLTKQLSATDSPWNFSLKEKLSLPRSSIQNRVTFGKLLNRESISHRLTSLTNDKQNISCNRQREQPGSPQCDNHEGKASAYYVVGEDQQLIYYCEKCAILTASQGFLVNKLKDKPPRETSPKRLARCKTQGANRYMSSESSKYHMREAEVKTLVTSLEVTARQLQNKQTSLQALAGKGEQQFQLELEHADEYFDQLANVVQRHRTSYRQLLTSQNDSLTSLTAELLTLISKSLERTLAMREDLLNNLQMVYNANENPYREIVDNYLANNRNFLGLVQEWKEEDLIVDALKLPELSRIVDMLDCSLQITPQTACPSRQGKAADTIYFSFQGSSLSSPNSTLVNASIPQQRMSHYPTIEEAISSDSDLLSDQ